MGRESEIIQVVLQVKDGSRRGSVTVLGCDRPSAIRGKKCEQPLKAGKGMEPDSLREPLEGA